ncbi:TPA: radical SAM protein [Clostridium botulinum]|nr:radical SAM protein [Clostridium botulinum]
MRFYKNIIRSYVDLPNNISMLIHSISCGCNLKCYGCFNYNDLIVNPPNEYYTEEDILNIIRKQGFMFDAIIFSGGEFLLEDIKDIEDLLKNIKKEFTGKIIIYTNGTNPNKVEYLLNKKLVDGFHVDMKLPYHLLDVKKDKDIFKVIIGFIPTQNMINNILKTTNIIVKNGSKYNQIRTVRYPVLTDDYFKEIKLYIKQLEERYNKKIQYKLNEFISE